MASTIASQGWSPWALSRLDLVDEDHRVAGDHAGEGEDAEERDEAQGACPARRSAATTPMTPSRRDADARGSVRLKPWSWSISTVSMMTSVRGTTAATDSLLPCRSPRRSRRRSTRYPLGKLALSAVDLRRQRLHDRGGLRARREVGLLR